MLGSLKELKAADQEVRDVLSQVADKIKAALNVAEYEVVSYKTQLVNGTNYFAKVKTPTGFAHVRVHKALDGAVTYSNAQQNLEESTEITHF